MKPNKKMTQKEFEHILLHTRPKILSEGEVWVSLRDLVWNIELYPIFKRMYRARQLAIRAILVLEYSGKLISIYGDVDRFFDEHLLDNVNDAKWREIVVQVSLNTYEFEQMFDESSFIRTSTKPMHYIYLHVLWSDVNMKYVISNKVRREFSEWITQFYKNLPKVFFNRLEHTGKRFQSNREMFMSEFEKRFPLPLRGEPRLFNRKEVAENAKFICQWKSPDGVLCNDPLPFELGQAHHDKEYSKGGKTEPTNALWICGPRNKVKGTKCIYDNQSP